MNRLLSSRAFWTAIVDAVIGIVFLIVGQFAPQYDQMVKQIWVLLQPVVLAIIAAFTSDEFAVKLARLLK